MYSWLGFTQDKLNDVVLTPSYVAHLLVKLARVDKDSYVWDFATITGTLISKLYQQGCKIYGQDFSERMMYIAQKKMPEAKLFNGNYF